MHVPKRQIRKPGTFKPKHGMVLCSQKKRKFSRKGTHNQFRTWCQGSLRASGNYVVLNMLDREEHSFMT